MRTWAVLVAALASVALVAGCSSSGAGATATVLDVTTVTMAFNPKEVTLAKGKPVKLVLKNEDTVLHDFSIDKIPVDKKNSEGAKHDDHSKEPDLHVAADSGKTGTVEFTPKEAGTYTYYCTVIGHKEAGMVGTLTVQ